MKNLGDKGAWAYPGNDQIFGVPAIISRMGKATNFNFGPIHSHGPPKQKPMKNLGEKGA